jgi:hypothetical protein
VPSERQLSFADRDHQFSPFYMAHSDHYLFLTDTQSRLRAYTFGVDGGGGMPVLVREFGDLKSPRGMAFHRATGTLLVACWVSGRDVRLLDTRPPPSAWKFGRTDRDRVTLGQSGIEPATLPPAFSIAIDEPNGFVYVTAFTPQHTVQSDDLDG